MNPIPQFLRLPSIDVDDSGFGPPERVSTLLGFTQQNGFAALAVQAIGPGGLTFLGLDDNSDNVAPITDARYAGVVSRLTGYDATANQWDRLRTLPDNTDGQAELTQGLLSGIARLQGYDQIADVFNRVRMVRIDDDEFIPADSTIAIALDTLARTALLQGTEYARARAITSLSVDPDAPVGVQQVAQTTEWTETNAPAAATAATVTRVNPGGGSRLVCRSITARIATAATAQTPLHVVLRDGATGVGTIIWETVVACPANSADGVTITPNIVGSADTDMTLEFTAAGVAASEQAVTLSGFTAS